MGHFFLGALAWGLASLAISPPPSPSSFLFLPSSSFFFLLLPLLTLHPPLVHVVNVVYIVNVTFRLCLDILVETRTTWMTTTAMTTLTTMASCLGLGLALIFRLRLEILVHVVYVVYVLHVVHTSR